MTTKKSNTPTIDKAAAYISSYTSEHLSLTGIIKLSKVMTTFEELVKSNDLSMGIISAKNLGYFIPVNQIDKDTFTPKNITVYVKRLKMYFKNMDKLNKLDAVLFSAELDIKKYTDMLSKLDAIYNTAFVDSVKLAAMDKLESYLYNADLLKISERKDAAKKYLNAAKLIKTDTALLIEERNTAAKK